MAHYSTNPDFSNEKLRRYDIIKLIASGAQGTAYLATDKVSNDKVVIKQIPFKKNGLLLKNYKQETVKELFDREVSILKILYSESECESNNVLCIKDVITDDSLNSGYIISEYLNHAENLIKYVSENESFFYDNFLSCAQQILNGLKYIHKKNVIHLDIKPENIIHSIDSTGKDKFFIIDFGSSCTDEDSCDFGGTLTYIAPEVLTNVISEKADIYSLGMTFIILLSDLKIMNNIGNNISKWFRLTDNIYGALNIRTKHPIFTYIKRGFFTPIFTKYPFIQSMVNLNPCKRPTAQELYDIITEMITSSSSKEEDAIEALINLSSIPPQHMKDEGESADDGTVSLHPSRPPQHMKDEGESADDGAVSLFNSSSKSLRSSQKRKLYKDEDEDED